MYKKSTLKVLAAFVFSFYSMACFAVDNNIQVFNLKNGHTVVIKEVQTNPIVTIDTWVKTGSVNETAQNNGVAHFLEHLFFKGTKNHKQGEFEKILEGKGGVFNAATSKDFTHFYVTIASQYFNDALDLHADMLLNPSIPPAELKRERKVVIEEIGRSEDNPQRTVFNNLNTTLFKQHPYKQTVLGTRDVVANIKRESIFDFYHKWYRPSNMVTVIVGDVDAEKILPLVTQEFKGSYTTAKAVKSKYKKEPFINKKTEVIEKGDYNTAYMIVGFKCVDIKGKKDSQALDLAGLILGDGRSSRLYQEIKEQKQLADSIDSGHYSLRDDSIFYVSSSFEPKNEQRLKKEIIAQLIKLRDGGVTQAELDKAKTILQRSFLYSNESVSNIANSIGYNMTLTGDIKAYTEYIDEINKITIEDVQKTLKKYILESKMAVSVLLPENNEKPVAYFQDQKGKTAKYRLDNGIDLITEKNDSNDIVSLSIFVKGGKFVESKPGTTSVLVKTLMKGTKTRSAVEIAQELEESGIVISPSINSDYFEISLKSTTQDFDKAFNVLFDILNNPKFDKMQIEKAKKDIINGIKSSRDDPSAVAFEEFGHAFYGNHPYGRNGKVLEKTVPTVSRGDVVSYFDDYIIPQNMVVSVAGNFEKSDIVNKFSSFKLKKGKIVDAKSFVMPFNALNNDKFIATEKDTSTAWYVIGWKAPSIGNEKDYATLKVLDTILGGGMSSRLFSNLREKQGLAYEISSTYPTRLDNTSFAMYIGTNPKNLELAKKGFLKEINRIKKEYVSEEELKSVKQAIIGRFALSQETNGQKAHMLGWYEVLGEGYQFKDRFLNLINNVTSEDIMKAANKYLNSPSVVSVIGPRDSLKVLKKEKGFESKR